MSVAIVDIYFFITSVSTLGIIISAVLLSLFVVAALSPKKNERSGLLYYVSFLLITLIVILSQPLGISYPASELGGSSLTGGFISGAIVVYLTISSWYLIEITIGILAPKLWKEYSTY